MLIIADQAASRVGGESRFAGAAQAEEQRHIVRVLGIDIRRAMHREHAFQRQQVIQNREDRFLQLARICRIPNDRKFLLEDRQMNVSLFVLSTAGRAFEDPALQ